METVLDAATREAISIALAEGVKNDVIIAALGVTDQQIIDVMREERDYFERVERDYREHEWPSVLKSIAEWQEEFPLWWRRERRREYLQDRIRELRETDPESDELRRLLGEARVHVGEVKGVTPEAVERARNHPITDFIKHRNFMAICPFHKDRSPSLNLKNNFYFCHGCGATGDVISFVMKTRNVTFRDAVTSLL